MCKVYGYVRISTVKQSLKRQKELIKELYPDAIFIDDETTGRNFDRPGWTKLYKAVKEGETIVFDEVSRMSRDADEGFAVYEDLYHRGVNLIFLAEPHINTSEYRDALQKTVNVKIQSGDTATDNLISSIMDALNKFMMEKVKSDIKKAFEKSQSEVDNNSRRTIKGIQAKQKRNEELKIKYPETYMDHPDYTQFGHIKGSTLTVKKERAIKQLIAEFNKDFNGSLSDVETIALINGMEEIKTPDGISITPHIGMTKNNNQKCRFINRATFYKYKREMRNGEG